MRMGGCCAHAASGDTATAAETAAPRTVRRGIEKFVFMVVSFVLSMWAALRPLSPVANARRGASPLHEARNPCLETGQHAPQLLPRVGNQRSFAPEQR